MVEKKKNSDIRVGYAKKFISEESSMEKKKKKDGFGGEDGEIGERERENFGENVMKKKEEEAHTIFEAGSKEIWKKEDLELVIEFQKKQRNDWRTLTYAMGKHRKHVKDGWRRIRLALKSEGHWTREEYQNPFDLMNKDLRMKAFQENHSKHGMLRDNIPWMTILLWEML